MTLAKNKSPAPTSAVAKKTPVRSPRRPVQNRVAQAEPKAVAPRAAPEVVKKSAKDAKKENRIRSTFSLPESRFELFAELKARCLTFGVAAKKSELIAAGLGLLNNLPETSLEAEILPLLRTDRKPAKTKAKKSSREIS